MTKFHKSHPVDRKECTNVIKFKVRRDYLTNYRPGNHQSLMAEGHCVQTPVPVYQCQQWACLLRLRACHHPPLAGSSWVLVVIVTIDEIEISLISEKCGNFWSHCLKPSSSSSTWTLLELFTCSKRTHISDPEGYLTMANLVSRSLMFWSNCKESYFSGKDCGGNRRGAGDRRGGSQEVPQGRDEGDMRSQVRLMARRWTSDIVLSRHIKGLNECIYICGGPLSLYKLSLTSLWQRTRRATQGPWSASTWTWWGVVTLS